MRTIVFIVLAQLNFCAIAQKQGKQMADSLIAALPNAANDTVKAKMLNRISLFYQTTNIDTAANYTDMGMRLVKKMNWLKGVSAFHTAYGNIFQTKALYDSALYHHQEALHISTQLKDSANIGVACNNLGSTAFSKGDYVNAAKYFMLTLKTAEQINNSYLAGLGAENVGNVYYYQQNYRLSLMYARKSLTVKQGYEFNKELIPNSLMLIGMNYKEMQQYDSAIHYFDSALVLHRANGNKKGEATVLTNYAQLYAYKKDYYKAIEYSLNAKSVWDKLDPDFESALENG
jgi:tetratricopeptide (TPR) repeat protein